MKKKFLIAGIGIALFAILFSIQLKPKILNSQCVGCGDCIIYCPVNCISIQTDGKAVIDTEKCINCKLCVTTCTFNAIK